MARIRSVKPTIWQDEEFGNATHESRLLFIGLITQADDDGRLNAAARLLWSLIYPWETFDGDALEERLGELSGLQLIQRYEKDGREYIALPSWEKHQKISHRTRSKIPKPPRVLGNGSGGLPESNGHDPEASSFTPDPIGETIGKEGKG